MPSVKTTAIAEIIDHTWLPELPYNNNPTEPLTQLCQAAISYQFAAICVRPQHVGQCQHLLAGHPVGLATVIGFPAKKVQLNDEWQAPTIGSAYLDNKLAEIHQALADDATELDIVWDVGAFLTGADLGKLAGTQAELAAYKAAAGEIPIKLIIETDLLPPAYVPLAAELCAKAGLAMVKTSTGYVQDGKGATVEAISAIRTGLGEAYPEKLGIKASGGIRTPSDAQTMVDAGATRLGTSNGVGLLSL